MTAKQAPTHSFPNLEVRTLTTQIRSALCWAFWGIIALSLTTRPLAGQGPPAPFSVLAVRVAGVGGAATSTAIHEAYTPKIGAALEAETPFYLGTITASAAVFRYGGRGSIPDFEAIPVLLGWGSEVTHGRLRIAGRVHVGNTLFYMHDKEIDWTAYNMESEFTVGAAAGPRLRLTPHLSLAADVTYHHVFTGHDIGLTWIMAGMEYEFRTPWLRAVLE